jgi:hypothetical protein
MPTTVVNLGPKQSFLKQVVLSDNFDGYNIDKIKPTSYNDLSETTNFFSIIRLIDFRFWSALTGDQIRRLFSRKGSKVDADFAQTAAVNSQTGVISFDSTYYRSFGSNPNAVAVGGNSNEIMMGIYFDSTTDDIQSRDYISPGRTIRVQNPFPNPSNFVYDYLPIKSQYVPFYKWKRNSGQSLFGTQLNDWYTSALEKVRYQKLDRKASKYPWGGDVVNEYNYRGYLFAVNSAGQYITNINMHYNPGLGGSPWYFYFGMSKGNTAMDRFYTKYIGESLLNA